MSLDYPGRATGFSIKRNEGRAALARTSWCSHDGRPVLMGPYVGRPPPRWASGSLLGWDASREAARGVGDALPILVLGGAARTVPGEMTVPAH